MDILDLTDVSELLGETEAVIVAACAQFPDHVPTTGTGLRRGFPPIALDVLRLITDSIAAGVPHEATLHLVETHFPTVPAALASNEGTQTAPPTPDPVAEHASLVDDESSVDCDPMAPDLALLVRGAVDAAVLPLVRDLVAGLSSMREETLAIRADLGLTTRSDDLELLRVETRGIARAIAEMPDAKEIISAASAALQSEIAGVRRVSDDLRSEIALLRAGLDQRDQFGEITAELDRLRSDLHRLTLAAQRSTDFPRPVVLSAGDGSGSTHQVEPERPNGFKFERHSGGPTPDSAPSPGDLAAATHETADDAPPAVITQFASRTPRRMGRSLVADDI